MIWQDYVFAIGAIVFIFALMPTVRGKSKPPLITSITTSIVLFVYSYNYLTLKLWFAMVTTAATATQWAVLAFQKYQQNHKIIN